MTSSSVVTLEEHELDMQALSAASSYFFTGWRPLANISNVEVRYNHPCGTALGFMTNFGAEHIVMGKIIAMIWVILRRWNRYRRRISTLAAKEKS